MATLQSSYSETFRPGFPGQIVNSEAYNIISRTLQGADLPFGQPVLRGSTDHTCILASQETYEAASAAVAGNTGNGTMGAVTVTAGAKLGVYKLTVITAASNAGVFSVEDPDGNIVDMGNVAAAFSSGGLAFTLADGATDFAVGDQFNITVTATTLTDVGNFLGLSKLDTTLGAEELVYEAGKTVAIMDMGVMWVTAGATVTPADPVYWNPATKRFTKTVTHLRIPGAEFDTSSTDGNPVRLRLRRPVGTVIS